MAFPVSVRLVRLRESAGRSSTNVKIGSFHRTGKFPKTTKVRHSRYRLTHVHYYTLHMTIFSTFSFCFVIFYYIWVPLSAGRGGAARGRRTRRVWGLCGGCGVARSPVRARMTSNSQELHEFVQLLPTQSLAKK
jgi:hypothetical protein